MTKSECALKYPHTECPTDCPLYPLTREAAVLLAVTENPPKDMANKEIHAYQRQLQRKFGEIEARQSECINGADPD